jgi:hypothetical protein
MLACIKKTVLETIPHSRIVGESEDSHGVHELHEHGLEIRCLVTQNSDAVADFIYGNDMALPESLSYFDPHSQWCAVVIPKFKIRWRDRLHTIRLGILDYHIIPGICKGTKFYPYVEDDNWGLCIELPECHESPEAILVEAEKSIHINMSIPPPTVMVADHIMNCVYSRALLNVSINRQGFYVNRKYRNKVTMVQEIGYTRYLIVSNMIWSTRKTFTDFSRIVIR